MKLVYALLTLLVATATTAQAGIYTLNVDDPSHVIVKINETLKSDLVAGDNEIELDLELYNYITVDPATGYLIKKAVDKNGEEYYMSGKTIYLSANTYTEEAQLYCAVTTVSEAEVYTSRLVVKIDNFENAYIRTSASREICFTENEQTVFFDPDKETQMQICGTYNATTYETAKVYGVKINNEDVSAQYGTYTFTPKDGDVVEITTTPPDVDYQFTLTEEDETGFITGVTVNGVEVEDFSSFTAHAGSSITISANTNDYLFESADFGNGIQTWISWPYTFIAEANVDIKIRAHKPGTIDVTFTIDDAENVEIWDGSTQLNLTSGTKVYSINEDPWGSSKYINIKSSSKGIVKSVLRNGEEIFNSYGTYTPIATGDIFEITTEKIVRDYTAAIYVDGFEDSYFFNCVDPTYKTIATLANGYTIFNFSNVDLPITLSFQPKNSSTASVYVGDELVNPQNEGSYSYSITPADGDVIKVFVNGEPDKYELSFDMPEKTEGISVYRDHITELTDFNTTSTAHAGTVYHVTVPDTENYSATVGTEKLTFDSENKAEFVPTENTTLVVTKKSSGIEDVKIDGTNAGEIYNLQGIRVRSDKSELPAGVYIIGGKKVLIK